jgi:twitching motility protein PilT
MILDPEQTDRLREVIAEGEFYGMQTFDQALLHHYQAGRVTMEAAVAAASSPHDFKLLVAGEGRTATSMNDLQPSDRPDEPSRSDRSMQEAPAAPARPVAAPAGPASNGRTSAPPPGFAG